ncbi:hypothetical protein EX30DRAFT_349204 [Ascodesmis nigricans]|uniref:Uncharacterized protein n=1 Tax=Ascodesmis nigricans TaxID=341454 RepID=A0A4S2MVL2_9PEZI|nr:hypothetical protein EX30DRAFT_349204 [Ascodesmis nigricans]
MDNLEPDKPNKVIAQSLDISMAQENHTGYNTALLQFMGQGIRAKMELEMLESSSSSDEDEEDHDEKDENKDDEEDGEGEVATDMEEPEERLSRRNMMLNMELVEELVEMRAVRMRIGKRVVFSEVVVDSEGGEARTKGFEEEGEEGFEEVDEEDYDADTE